MEKEPGYVRIPTWMAQMLLALMVSLMGWAINQAYSKINEINTHLVATDLRVTVLEQHRNEQ